MARVFCRLRSTARAATPAPWKQQNPFAAPSFRTTNTTFTSFFSSRPAAPSANWRLRILGSGLVAASTSLVLASGALASPLYADGSASNDSGPLAVVAGIFKPLIDSYLELKEALCGDQSILLPPLVPDPYGRPVRTVCINFEKTMVYPTWTREYGWVIRKRPYVTLFLERVARAGYEVVLFSDSQQFEIEGNIMELDVQGAMRHKLFKDSTNFKQGCYIKDLSRLGRDLKSVVLIDHNYLDSAKLQPENAFHVSVWKDDLKDKELYRLMLILEKAQKYNVHDMRDVVRRYNEDPTQDIFAQEEKRAREYQRQLEEEEGVAPVESGSTKGKGGSKGGSWMGGIFNRKS